MTEDLFEFFDIRRLTADFAAVCAAGKLEADYKRLHLQTQIAIAQQLCVISRALKSMGGITDFADRLRNLEHAIGKMPIRKRGDQFDKQLDGQG